MTDRTPTTYNPPQYLIASSGLTAAQLTTQFEAFKDSLKFAQAAPELIFERVLANAFATTTSEPEHDNLHGICLAELQGEVQELQDKLAAMTSGIISDCSDSSFDWDAPATGTSLSSQPAAPIKFTFVRSGKAGLGVKADRYDKNDGCYGVGCSWSDLGYSSSDFQYGSYNTAEDIIDLTSITWVERTMKFSHPFPEGSRVVLWLTGVDIRCDKLCKVQASVLWSDNTSFKFGIRVSEKNALYSAGVAWVAYGTENSFKGRFNVQAYASCDKAGIHHFPGRRTPSLGVLAVDEVVLSGKIKWPLTLHLHRATSDELGWVLRTSVDGSAFCLLGIRFIFFTE